jgi:hypothetical protein
MKKRKTKRVNIHTYGDAASEDRIMRELHSMKHRDLQRACIARGMDFQQMVSANHHALVSWFFKHYDIAQDPNLLVEYDKWVEDQLLKRGYTKGKEFLHPLLKFGISGDIERVKNVSELKAEEPKKVPHMGKKPHSEKNLTFNIKKGTKKEMTFTLTESGLEINQIIKQVIDAFPDAQEKSIRIWQKRCLKAMKENREKS